MNESAEYTRLLAQAYSKLADDYAAMTLRVIDAEKRLRAACDDEHARWIEATEWKLRADAAEDELKTLRRNAARDSELIDLLGKRADEAEAYVRALEEVCDSEQLKCAQASARQQGNVTPTYQTSGVVRARLEQQAAMQAELNSLKQGGAK